MFTNKLFYTVPEVREILPIKKSELYNLINSGKVPSVKVDGKILIPVNYVRQLMAGQEPKDAK